MMETEWVDLYETLEIHPKANSETIERLFRYLAQRYHPDHKETGDEKHFSKIIKAYDILKDPEKRAAYDVLYSKVIQDQYKLKKEAYDTDGFEYDDEIRDKLLSVLYVKCRRNINDPGVGNYQLQQMLACPDEHFGFHLWYMKEKGWITRMEDGMLSITVAGVDQVNEIKANLKKSQLLLLEKAESIHL